MRTLLLDAAAIGQQPFFATKSAKSKAAAVNGISKS